MTEPGPRTNGLAPWVEMWIVAGVLLGVTWLMLWIDATQSR